MEVKANICSLLIHGNLAHLNYFWFLFFSSVITFPTVYVHVLFLYKNASACVVPWLLLIQSVTWTQHVEEHRENWVTSTSCIKEKCSVHHLDTLAHTVGGSPSSRRQPTHHGENMQTPDRKAPPGLEPTVLTTKPLVWICSNNCCKLFYSFSSQYLLFYKTAYS